jgi:hypothetical protein
LFIAGLRQACSDQTSATPHDIRMTINPNAATYFLACPERCAHFQTSLDVGIIARSHVQPA